MAEEEVMQKLLQENHKLIRRSHSRSHGETETEAYKELRSVSKTELQGHSKPESMWLAIDGLVYDVTKWAFSHPGGPLVLQSMAGQDATEAYMAFHPVGSVPRHVAPFGRLEGYSPSKLSQDYQTTYRHLVAIGLFKPDIGYYARLAVCLVIAFAACLAGVLLCRNVALHLVCAVVLGFFWSQASYVMHDLAHSPIFPDPFVNRHLEIFVANCFTGLSPTWWRRSHNAHHVATNDVSYDPDVQLMPFFAITEKLFSGKYSKYHDSPMGLGSLGRLLVSYQHWTFYPIMFLVARLNLLIQAFVFFKKQVDLGVRIPRLKLEILGLLVFWSWYLALVWALPGGNLERIAFVFMSCGATALQHIQFCLNHFPCEMRDDFTTTTSDNGPHGDISPSDDIETNWVEKQLRGTLNIDCSPWIDWLHGGLQFQVEHHLFPRLPRHSLRKAAPYVRQLCLKHDLPYNSFSFFGANYVLFTTLRDAASHAKLFIPH